VVKEDPLKRYERLARLVDEVLYWVWDPIGVNDSFASRSEYETYVPGVVKILLMEESDQEKIASLAGHLENLARVNMGLSFATKNAQETAERLVEDLGAWTWQSELE
jgi:hypothetical protein